MSQCKQCKKTKENPCVDCDGLIDGGILRRKLEYFRQVVFETSDGDQFMGEIVAASPVGLGAKVQLRESDYYYIHLDEHLKVKAGRIAGRGREGCHGFDIIEVYRNDDVSSSRLSHDEFKVLTMSNEQLVATVTKQLPQSVKGIIRERMKTELEKAKILDALQVGQVYKYEKGYLKSLGAGEKNLKISTSDLAEIADECRKSGSPCREVILDNEKMYDVHGIPFNYESGGLLVLDVTSLIKKEREIKKREKRIYADVIEAVTEGKLRLVEREEIKLYTSLGVTLIESTFKQPEDLEPIRSKVENLLILGGISPKEVYRFLLCISEALTNAIKHADGGVCRVIQLPKGYRVEVSDRGSGINLTNLPKATLMRSFSTKKSLGCGFTLMLKYVDRLIMATGVEGTTLVIEKSSFPEGLTSEQYSSANRMGAR